MQIEVGFLNKEKKVNFLVLLILFFHSKYLKLPNQKPPKQKLKNGCSPKNHGEFCYRNNDPPKLKSPLILKEKEQYK